MKHARDHFTGPQNHKPMVGIEPTTYALRERRSTTELHRRSRDGSLSKRLFLCQVKKKSRSFDRPNVDCYSKLGGELYQLDFFIIGPNPKKVKLNLSRRLQGAESTAFDRIFNLFEDAPTKNQSSPPGDEVQAAIPSGTGVEIGDARTDQGSSRGRRGNGTAVPQSGSPKGQERKGPGRQCTEKYTCKP